MAPINQKTMKLLKEHLGKDVILQGVACGRNYSYRTKLWKVIDFGVINSSPLIGMNSAVIQIIDVETGKILMRNPIIKSTLDWNDAGVMWRLRFRSYGLLVTFGMSSLGSKMQKYIGWTKSGIIFST